MVKVLGSLLSFRSVSNCSYILLFFALLFLSTTTLPVIAESKKNTTSKVRKSIKEARRSNRLVSFKHIKGKLDTNKFEYLAQCFHSRGKSNKKGNAGSLTVRKKSVRSKPSTSADRNIIARAIDNDFKFRLAILGDGFTSKMKNQYDTTVAHWVDSIFKEEPFANYQSYFQVDPIYSFSKKDSIDCSTEGTALGVAFQCGKVERFLLWDENEIISHTNNYDSYYDSILVIANSEKFGGSASINGLIAAATTTAGPATAIHELGHSIGGLADEYEYYSNSTDQGGQYTGPELDFPNLSILRFSHMQASGTKWASWLGLQNIATFEGGGFMSRGIFRPTLNSKMRSESAPFHAPAIEELVKKIYRDKFSSHIIRYHYPRTTEVINGESILRVNTIQTAKEDIKVKWYLGDVEIPNTNNLQSIKIIEHIKEPGLYWISAKAQDTTTFVKDENFRNTYMTNWVNWQVEVTEPSNNEDSFRWHNSKSPFDTDKDGDIDPADALHIANEINSNGEHILPIQNNPPIFYFDVNADGSVTQADFNLVIDYLNRNITTQSK